MEEKCFLYETLKFALKKIGRHLFSSMLLKIKVFSIQKFRFSACVCWAALFNVLGR